MTRVFQPPRSCRGGDRRVGEQRDPRVDLQVAVGLQGEVAAGVQRGGHDAHRFWASLAPWPKDTAAADTSCRPLNARGGTPEKVGTVAAWLMGPDDAFMTGSDILMDGSVTASGRFGYLAPLNPDGDLPGRQGPHATQHSPCSWLVRPASSAQWPPPKSLTAGDPTRTSVTWPEHVGSPDDAELSSATTSGRSTAVVGFLTRSG